jgi:hypothetical protein
MWQTPEAPRDSNVDLLKIHYIGDFEQLAAW